MSAISCQPPIRMQCEFWLFAVQSNVKSPQLRWRNSSTLALRKPALRARAAISRPGCRRFGPGDPHKLLFALVGEFSGERRISDPWKFKNCQGILHSCAMALSNSLFWDPYDQLDRSVA